MLVVSRFQLFSIGIPTKLSTRAALFRLGSLSGKRNMSSETGYSSLILSPSEFANLPPSTTKPVDVTWFMPNVSRNPLEEFLAKRIPGSRRMDLDEVASEHELGLSHMMPSPEVFASACENIGIEPSSHVVFYDTIGVFSAPRALFMFKAFGHQKASILNGGLQRWVHEGYPTESGDPSPVERTSYATPKLDQTFLRSYADMFKNAQVSKDAAELVLDARSKGRFMGTDPEPRPSLSSGHMPNSASLPFMELLENRSTGSQSSYTILRPASETKKVFGSVLGDDGLMSNPNIVNSCGSGMTAAVLWLALQELGVNSAIYDESWTGYASRKESQILKEEHNI